MAFIEGKTVREIAIENPATVPLFESLGIDYCCGGRRPLEEACERANVSVAHVLDRIAKLEARQTSPEKEHWADARLAELMDHIVTRHHGYVRQEIPRLEQLLNKVVSKHGPAHPELASIQSLFTAVAEELQAHMMKEEHMLFPHIEKLERAISAGEPVPASCFATVQMPIARMLAEHDDAGEITSQIRAFANDFKAPDDACPSYRGLYHGLNEFERDLHRHVHLENNILFPRAVEMERSCEAAA